MVAHRAGALNLVIPVAIGAVGYLEQWQELTFEQLQQAVTYLAVNND